MVSHRVSGAVGPPWGVTATFRIFGADKVGGDRGELLLSIQRTGNKPRLVPFHSHQPNPLHRKLTGLLRDKIWEGYHPVHEPFLEPEGPSIFNWRRLVILFFPSSGEGIFANEIPTLGLGDFSAFVTACDISTRPYY